MTSTIATDHAGASASATPHEHDDTRRDPMEQAGLTRMIKVEVVVDSDAAPDVEALFRAEGVTGWTGLTGLTGVGHAGRHEGRALFNERGGQTMLVAVLPRDRLDGVVAGLTAHFAGHHGVMFVSETWVSRPTYFGV